MFDRYKIPFENAIRDLEGESARRTERTPSDVSIEAFDFAARRVKQALAEADAASAMLTPTEYAEMHGVTAQSVTRWIRIGELAAEETAGGYRIARDAVRTPRIHAEKLDPTG